MHTLFQDSSVCECDQVPMQIYVCVCVPVRLLASIWLDIGQVASAQ